MKERAFLRGRLVLSPEARADPPDTGFLKYQFKLISTQSFQHQFQDEQIHTNFNATLSTRKCSVLSLKNYFESLLCNLQICPFVCLSASLRFMTARDRLVEASPPEGRERRKTSPGRIIGASKSPSVPATFTLERTGSSSVVAGLGSGGEIVTRAW